MIILQDAAFCVTKVDGLRPCTPKNPERIKQLSYILLTSSQFMKSQKNIIFHPISRWELFSLTSWETNGQVMAISITTGTSKSACAYAMQCIVCTKYPIDIWYHCMYQISNRYLISQFRTESWTALSSTFCTLRAWVQRHSLACGRQLGIICGCFRKKKKTYSAETSLWKYAGIRWNMMKYINWNQIQ